MLPELVLVSPAVRTKQTYTLARHSWPTGIPVRFVRSLYEASAETLLNIIFSEGKDCQNVMVIGHNPSLIVLLNYMISNYLTDINTMAFPTCCIAHVGFDAPTIEKIEPEMGKLLVFKKVLNFQNSF